LFPHSFQRLELFPLLFRTASQGKDGVGFLFAHSFFGIFFSTDEFADSRNYTCTLFSVGTSLLDNTVRSVRCCNAFENGDCLTLAVT
tara:strand:- start:181 stop:441 length:261 start_codon:yes stop_codon:yes gene_type:complete